MKTFEIKPLKWDSELFGYNIQKINVPEKVSYDEATDFKWLNKPLPRLTIIECNKNYADLLKSKNEISLEETKLTYQLNLNEFKTTLENPNIRQITDSIYAESLYPLALEAGKLSRYKLDPKMNNSEFEKLYMEWIINSLKGKFDHFVFAEYEGNEPVGLLTLRETTNDITIGLISVKITHQGKGIGKNLIQKAKNFAKKGNYKNILVSTQAINTSASNFYLKSGFDLHNTDQILHYWKY